MFVGTLFLYGGEFIVFGFDADLVFSIFFGLFALIAFIVTFVRTGSVKKSLNNFVEVFELSKKYNTEDTRPVASQSFSRYVDDYALDGNNELVKLDTPKDIQAYIDSYVDCALERALEKFLPDVTATVDDVEELEDVRNGMDSMMYYNDLAEEYREKFNLPATYSISDIYSYLNSKALELNEKISNSKEVLNGSSKKAE
ncbi:hypothetical protein [Peromfec virus RodF8_53]|uniref:Uncharacterized protein n=1 Tax=Peromfec virus RodF8_53 TaxID=2929382 RepID=A0A976N2B5_9VIRU|nr:hypothetical protein [Peromfec virus RodF8_53]